MLNSILYVDWFDFPFVFPLFSAFRHCTRSSHRHTSCCFAVLNTCCDLAPLLNKSAFPCETNGMCTYRHTIATCSFYCTLRSSSHLAIECLMADNTTKNNVHEEKRKYNTRMVIAGENSTERHWRSKQNDRTGVVAALWHFWTVQYKAPTMNDRQTIAFK